MANKDNDKKKEDSLKCTKLGESLFGVVASPNEYQDPKTGKLTDAYDRKEAVKNFQEGKTKK